MEHSLQPVYLLGSSLFSYAAALTVTGFVLRALIGLVRGRSVDHTRAVLVKGMLAGLSLTAAATLLRLLAARSWQDVAMIAVLLALRTGLKQALRREQRYVGAESLP